MIAHIRGALIAATTDSVIVDVSGVGYRCLVPLSSRSRLPVAGAEVLLHTSMQIREDSMTLYGFLTREEFDLFELLLRVEGVGPKLALGVLSASSPDGFRRSIAYDDVTALCRIPGIGKKTAQRMVLELKDKVGAIPTGGVAAISLPSEAGTVGDANPVVEALEALMALGYSRAEAAQAVEQAAKEIGPEVAVETLVRVGLKHLFRG